ncbi:hypothetical protein HG536_0A03360 [Torulaspora globosa]|uniref:Uncharacterized protein n=1 Tax=Torulaspora globosa TaxID=48254 RepID=A0A7G3ZAI2_9SACH|nr:uncharacterized protein HG536_0A03360 [Torulaspora globosa]QLL30518.1 hypothetical protein HG536_0A03360 [Torulaspora globosa]
MAFPRRIPIGGWKHALKPESPTVITFDAYNTLYATTLPVMQQYCLVAKKYNVIADPMQLTMKFPKVFKELRDRHPNYGKFTGITAVEWWSKLITNVFQPLEISKEMVEEILVRFEGYQAYQVYPDVLDFIKEAKSKHPDVILGIISNTDPVVYTLLQNLGLYEYFKPHIFLSYDLDLKKPSKEIFEYALEDMAKRYPRLLENNDLGTLRSRCWHIGDEAINDMRGAENAGWNGVLIDRNNKYGHLSRSFEHKDRSSDLLSVDKIDTTSSISYEESLRQMDTVLLGERAFVVSNFKTLQDFLL